LAVKPAAPLARLASDVAFAGPYNLTPDAALGGVFVVDPGNE
jgi:hypothetical protein